MDVFMLIAIIVLGLGVLFLLLGSLSFRFRAMANKRAWNGKTKPLLGIGIVLLIAGIVLVYFAYKSAFPDA